jgi:hypothetical protein
MFTNVKIDKGGWRIPKLSYLKTEVNTKSVDLNLLRQLLNDNGTHAKTGQSSPLGKLTVPPFIPQDEVRKRLPYVYLVFLDPGRTNTGLNTSIDTRPDEPFMSRRHFEFKVDSGAIRTFNPNNEELTDMCLYQTQPTAAQKLLGVPARRALYTDAQSEVYKHFLFHAERVETMGILADFFAVMSKLTIDGHQLKIGNFKFNHFDRITTTQIDVMKNVFAFKTGRELELTLSMPIPFNPRAFNFTSVTNYI